MGIENGRERNKTKDKMQDKHILFFFRLEKIDLQKFIRRIE
jgi:hypothetical protein